MTTSGTRTSDWIWALSRGRSGRTPARTAVFGVEGRETEGLRAAIERARTHGAQTLGLSTFADRAWNAPFYARHDFEVIDPEEAEPALRAIRETEQEAVRREAMEELGCVVEPRHKLQQLPSNNGHYLLHYWYSEIVEGEPRINNDELDALRWVTLAELRALDPVFQEDLDLFASLLEGREQDG